MTSHLRTVPYLVPCTGCGAWIRPAEWGIPGDLALIDPVAQVILGDSCGCAAREAEKIREAAEGRGG